MNVEVAKFKTKVGIYEVFTNSVCSIVWFLKNRVGWSL